MMILNLKCPFLIADFKGLQTGEEEANVLTIDTDRVEPSENLLNLLDSNRKQNGPRSKPQSRENPRYSEINGLGYV